MYYKCVNCGFETYCWADLSDGLEEQWIQKPTSKKYKDAKKDWTPAILT
jgi:hypothetical protein